MQDCLFCKIAGGAINAGIVYRGDDVVAFEDINPKAPIHIIIISKKHIERISDIRDDDAGLIGKLFLAAKKVAEDKNIKSSGYRLVINCNKDAGQEVMHLHLHLLGGRKFTWPPG
jgi:histidine triad (HIT) family protein